MFISRKSDDFNEIQYHSFEENETYLRNINLVGKVGDRSIYISWYSEQYSLLYIYIKYQRLLRFLAHKYLALVKQHLRNTKYNLDPSYFE